MTNNGCGTRKCACPLWINCDYYCDARKREQRLKQKAINIEIQRWYTEIFRVEWLLGSSVANG